MLSVEAPFPNPGAKALLIENHKAHPVRILQIIPSRDDAASGARGARSAGEQGRGRNREVLISLQAREGSSGNRRVKVADLEDATPLSAEELAEMAALERELAGQARPLKAKEARYERLRLRHVHAEQLADVERRAHRTAPPMAPIRSRGRG